MVYTPLSPRRDVEDVWGHTSPSERRNSVTTTEPWTGSSGEKADGLNTDSQRRRREAKDIWLGTHEKRAAATPQELHRTATHYEHSSYASICQFGGKGDLSSIARNHSAELAALTGVAVSGTEAMRRSGDGPSLEGGGMEISSSVHGEFDIYLIADGDSTDIGGCALRAALTLAS